MKKTKLIKPNLEDCEKIYTLVNASKPLDLNSRYAYMLVSTHFRDTSIIAKVDNKIVGFISSYVLPEFQNILFVWQVAVDISQRGQGLALSLLRALLKRDNLQDINFIETTICPSNIASKKLFLKLAKSLETQVEEEIYFRKELFVEEAHEDEILYKVGPFNLKKV
jgi:L-2,4-diaminobutyric acid acetyltransferase